MPATANALFRIDARDPEVAERLDVIADALTTPSPADWDDVDRLSQSGDWRTPRRPVGAKACRE